MVSFDWGRFGVGEVFGFSGREVFYFFLLGCRFYVRERRVSCLKIIFEMGLGVLG